MAVPEDIHEAKVEFLSDVTTCTTYMRIWMCSQQQSDKTSSRATKHFI